MIRCLDEDLEDVYVEDIEEDILTEEIVAYLDFIEEGHYKKKKSYIDCAIDKIYSYF